MADTDPTGNYCEYLDKEMTIMGLLTAFAVVVPALVLDRTAGAVKKEGVTILASLWDGPSRTYLGVGCLMCFLAALMFYLQRSALAFWYGQLRFSQTDASYAGLTTKNILLEADSWATWRSYASGFVFLIVGFVCFGEVLFLPDLISTLPVISSVVTIVLPLMYLGLRCWVVTRYRFEDHPWQTCFPLWSTWIRHLRRRLLGT
jgi:hypothetical protein